MPYDRSIGIVKDMNIKYLIALGIIWTAPVMVSGQDFDFNLDKGITVEESYLQESVKLMLIREQSRADSRELKLSALSNIGEAIKRGVTGGEVLSALEHLALEGTVNRRAYQNSRGYPDIRGKAAAYLGELGGPEAKDVLIRMAGAEHDATVLTQMITALKKIGLNENQETVNVITVILSHFNMFSPDNLLALSGLEAYETFAAQNGWKLDPASMLVISHIADGRYHGSIRQRAKQLLTLLRTYRRGNAAAR